MLEAAQYINPLETWGKVSGLPRQSGEQDVLQ